MNQLLVLHWLCPICDTLLEYLTSELEERIRQQPISGRCSRCLTLSWAPPAALITTRRGDG